MSAIKVKNITKNYGNICALDNISLTFESNKIYGLLGRNGAGKTTLLNLITNRLFPTEGEITIDDDSVIENDSAIEKVFYMAEKNLYEESYLVKKVFKWTKEFYPDFDMDYALSLCDKFGLKANKKFKSLSTGYNSITKLIITLSSNAKVLIFDEPILGLDACHRELFYKELLDNFIKKPKTIIISTHIIEEISDILERVVVINKGKIALDDNVEKILEKAWCVSGAAKNIDEFVKSRNCINVEQMGAFKSATIMGEVTELDEKEAKDLELEFSKVELQKLFIHLTKGGMNK
ncbi:ABC transporter ATP-binding protein [Herbivorax sp. ANBcel31]|uniref:ABC transporter ATP-binding protein n=1 Tax=Herbivorax sp. ANBcel31 TaxID=3069754 RepID=UPI0027B0B219|nr:ABC transporter ATP-binding protein [Herbivorax sp. ANBcel31]MDQ2085603.1 ABC transporter ATP-binding protein [Herbivorax sp. ANBcel31]